MKAWRLIKPGEMRLDNMPVPEIRPGWVLIKVNMVQPSITEVQWSRGIFLEVAPRMEKLLEERKAFSVFGHEFCGTIVEVGENVKNLREGDRVFYWRRAPCRKCDLCLSGNEELCRKGPILGLDIDGCFAEYLLLPAESVTSVPDSISDSEAAAMQPLAGVVADVHAVDIDTGDTIVILGQGVMGLNTMQVCRVCGAGRVIGVDVRDDVLALSSELGADIVINTMNIDAVSSIMEATNGKGADIVFECAGGNPQQGLSGTRTLSQALKVVRDGGKIVQVANLEADAHLDVGPINMRGIRYCGHGSCNTKLVEFSKDLVVSKRVKISPLITHALEGLDRINEAFDITGNKAKFSAINPAQVRIG